MTYMTYSVFDRKLNHTQPNSTLHVTTNYHQLNLI